MRPDYPNATYYGDIKRTIHNRETVSLIGILGRAWQDEGTVALDATYFERHVKHITDPEEYEKECAEFERYSRWYFEPCLNDKSDANVYLVYADSLKFL